MKYFRSHPLTLSQNQDIEAKASGGGGSHRPRKSSYWAIRVLLAATCWPTEDCSCQYRNISSKILKKGIIWNVSLPRIGSPSPCNFCTGIRMLIMSERACGSMLVRARAPHFRLKRQSPIEIRRRTGVRCRRYVQERPSPAIVRYSVTYIHTYRTSIRSKKILVQ